jgi:ligand-binding sensor domain-containing protein
MKQLSLALYFICFLITTFSQNPEWVVYDTTNSELPSNNILCIAIDDSNNKWIGTSVGLIKYNNVEWELYNESNSGLPTNFILDIAIDVYGNKWMGTLKGLVKFDGLIWEVYDTTNSGLPGNRIEEIAIDNNENKWLGRVRSDEWQSLGLVKFDNFTWTVYDTTNSGLPSNNVWCIEIDEDNNKWIGTSYYSWGPSGGKGLVKYNDTTWTLYNKENDSLPGNSIVDIAIDSSGNKWILTQDGLGKFDDIKWNVYERDIENCGDVWCLTIDAFDNKWLGLNGMTNGYGCGVSKFDNLGWQKIYASDLGLPSDQVRCISIDKYGNKWIGTVNIDFSGGLAVYNEGGVITDVQKQVVGKTIPEYYSLNQNYPNPFNPSTKIKYSIPASVMLNSFQHINNEIPDQARNDNIKVQLKIYDVLGSKVATIVSKEQPSGNYEVDFDGSDLTSGIYFYRLHAGVFVETKKMILLK